VARELQERGFGEVFTLRGGFKAWQQAGLPVEEIPNQNNSPRQGSKTGFFQ